ncbi:MAG: tetratricopeptide repeat protein [Mariprofundaceae bacterium]
MTQKNQQKTEEPIQDESHLTNEIDELKRDMRSAKLTDWLQQHQQQLLVGAVVLLVLLMAGGLWSEKQKTYKASAAMMYYQALASADDKQRQALFESVVKDFSDTGYAILSHVRLAVLSDREKHLRIVMDHSEATTELKWQARLDLAEYLIEQDNKAEAKTLLQARTGSQFEQLRHYLLSQVASAEEKQTHLQKALDAISNDNVLKTTIETQLAKLSARQ